MKRSNYMTIVLFYACRLQALERSLIIENGEASSVVQDIKLKVDSFKEKLEVCKLVIDN